MTAPMRAYLAASLSTMCLIVGAAFAADAFGWLTLDSWPWWLRCGLWIASGALGGEVGIHFEERAERRASADRETPP